MARLCRLTWLLAFALWALVASNAARAATGDYEAGFYWHPEGDFTHRYPTGSEAIAYLYAGQQAYRQVEYCTPYAGGVTVQFRNYFEFYNSATRGGYSAEWSCQAAPYTGWYSASGYVDRNACTVGAPDCPEPPPAPPDCTLLANKKILAQAADVPDSFVPETTPCLAGCSAFKTADQPWHRMGPSGHRDFITRYQMTGQTCTSEPVPLYTTTTTTGPVTDDGFKTVPDAAPGCGFYNNEYVCMPPADKCWVTPSGARLCAEGAPTPPVPRTPDDSAPATPDQTQQVCTGSNSCQQVNYYNSNTVNASGSDPTPVGDPNAQGDPTGGTGPGTGSGTGTGTDPTADDSASGGGDCSAAPSCDGDPIQCNLLMQQWKTRCVTSPTSAEALTAIGATEGEIAGIGPHDENIDLANLSSDGPVSVGSCPAPIGINVMGQSISLDIWQQGCNMALLFAPLVMLIGYLSAAMLFLRSNW